MNRSWTVALLLAFAGLTKSAADANSPVMLFLFVKDSVWSNYGVKKQQGMSDRLPRSLLEGLQAEELGFFQGMPEKLNVLERDLDRDGRVEYFIETNHGGSGGPHYYLYAAPDGRWVRLASLQGIIHVLPCDKGWPRLVEITRGGPELFVKTTWEFREGVYVSIHRERFDHGIIQEISAQP